MRAGGWAAYDLMNEFLLLEARILVVSLCICTCDQEGANTLVGRLADSARENVQPRRQAVAWNTDVNRRRSGAICITLEVARVLLAFEIGHDQHIRRHKQLQKPLIRISQGEGPKDATWKLQTKLKEILFMQNWLHNEVSVLYGLCQQLPLGVLGKVR